jgi:hypothetical protein
MFRGHVFVMLTMCFDGSGKDDDPNSKFVTLAGFAGEQDAWGYFNEQWSNALGNLASYMHMTEAIQHQEEFDGWNEAKTEFLVDRLLEVIVQTFARYRFQAVRFTIDVSAHRHFSAANNTPGVSKSLALGAFYRMFRWYTQSSHVIVKPMVILFDRGEPYLNILMQRWNSKGEPDRKPWWDLISSIAPVSMKNVPGVQAADMLGWSANRIRTSGTAGWPGQIAEKIIGTIPHLWNEVEQNHIKDRRFPRLNKYGFHT